MGVMERDAKREQRHKQILGTFQLTLLATVAVGVVVLIAATAPNAAQLLKYFPGYKKGAKFNYQSKSALGRLVAKGLVTFVEENGKRYARITEKGERVLEAETLREGATKKRRWDRRWRIVIFDIPERRKSVRA